jgi:hypothetical protein
MDEHPLIGDAYRALARETPTIPVCRALAFLRELATELATHPALPDDVRPLHCSVVEEGPVLLEWIFCDRRLGFSFEAYPKESGWYFVSATTTDASDYGLLGDESAALKSILLRMQTRKLIR